MRGPKTMHGRRYLTRLLLLLLLLLPPVGARAEEPGGWAHELRNLRSAGRYGDATVLIAKIRSEKPKDPVAAAAQADLFLEVGRFADAEKAANAGGTDPRCRTLLAESLLDRGRLAEASSALSKALTADPPVLRARYDAGLLALAKGDREAARKAFRWFFPYWEKHDVEDAEGQTFVALASIRLAELEPDVQMDFDVTEKLLQDVISKHPDYLPAYVARGRLFLAGYEDQSALKWFRRALAKNGRYPPALLGVADQEGFRFEHFAGMRKAKAALLTDPNLFGAREYIAKVRMGDSRYPEAEKEIGEVLAVDPYRKRSRGLKAAIDYLVGNRDAFGKEMKALLADDPHYAVGYVDLAETLEQQRRFGEAVTEAREATRIDPENWRSFWVLGRNLVHIGKETEGKKALETSRNLDPFAAWMNGNPFRENLIDVLGHLADFVETRTPHFIYRINVSENDVLSLYYHRYLEHSFDLLTKEYSFVPEFPVLVEVFNHHADFAARTIGLGHLGALGACFGQVITLDSPSSRPPGAFCWASTARHEFTHVITLQLSKGRVPRWFTEGMSVYEEGRFGAWCERRMDRRLFDAYSNHELPPVATFNQDFRQGDILFAYYVGGQMCKFMVEEFSLPKVIAMLKAYGRDMQTKNVLKDVLGLSEHEFDARFRKWVGAKVGSFELQPRWSQRTLDRMNRRLVKDPKDLDALVTAAFAYFQRRDSVDSMALLGRALAIKPDDPRLALLRGEIAAQSHRDDQAKKWLGKYLAAGKDSFDCRMILARIHEKEGDAKGAIQQYEAAKACFPLDPGPWQELARLRKGENDLAGAMKEEAGLARLEPSGIRTRMHLAHYYATRGDLANLVKTLEQVVWIYPLGKKSAMDVHVPLARSLVKLGRPGDYSRAAMEYRVALDLGVPKKSEPKVRVALAKVWLLLGKTKEAVFQARAALDVDPSYGPAKELLDQHPAR